MALNSVGTETRRSVLLVLHDSSQPWITMAIDWQPKGLCPQQMSIKRMESLYLEDRSMPFGVRTMPTLTTVPFTPGYHRL